MELRLHGRGGQGGVTCAKILAACYARAGKHVQAFADHAGERFSAASRREATNTTPRGKTQRKKDIVAIMAANRVPYAATVSLAHPEDALRNMRAALDLQGFRSLHELAPCQTGCKSESADGVELICLAVRSGLFLVHEVFDGRRKAINVEPELSLDPLRKYFALQVRFNGDGVHVEARSRSLNEDWANLRRAALWEM